MIGSRFHNYDFLRWVCRRTRLCPVVIVTLYSNGVLPHHGNGQRSHRIGIFSEKTFFGSLMIAPRRIEVDLRCSIESASVKGSNNDLAFLEALDAIGIHMGGEWRERMIIAECHLE